MRTIFTIVLTTIILSGCSIFDPLVYKIDIQQGNVTEQKQVEKLEIGMTKEQVKFILGSPMSTDSFDANRWDYVYSYLKGKTGKIKRNNITITFENNRMTKMVGEALIKKNELGPKGKNKKNKEKS